MNDVTRIPARPTVYNGVKMRSRLEAGFAMWLDGQEFDWEYEPQAFANEDGQYLPDFRINGVGILGLTSEQSWHVYCEVKPYRPTGDYARALYRRMVIINSSEPDTYLLVAYKDPTPGWLLLGGRCFAHHPMECAWITLAANPPKPGIREWVGVLHHEAIACSPWSDDYWEGPGGY